MNESARSVLGNKRSPVIAAGSAAGKTAMIGLLMVVENNP